MSLGLLIGTSLTLIGQPMFMLFMMEEAVQTAGFAIFVLMRSRQWTAARYQVGIYRKQAQTLQEWSISIMDFIRVLDSPDDPRLLTGQKMISDINTAVKALIAKLKQSPGELPKSRFPFLKFPPMQKTVDILPAGELKIGSTIANMFLPFLMFADSAISAADAYDKAISKGIIDDALRTA